MIDQIARDAPAKINDLCQKWRLPKEVGADIARLGLYDIVLFVGKVVQEPFGGMYAEKAL